MVESAAIGAHGTVEFTRLHDEFLLAWRGGFFLTEGDS